MSHRPWSANEDVVLPVAGRYTLLGVTLCDESENGTIVVRWSDDTRTRIRADLLMTPGDAALVPTLDEVTGERERARGLAARLEADLAQIDMAVNGPAWVTHREMVIAVRSILRDGELS
jgi:hypothetical protein